MRITRYGLPEQIVSDNGPQFTSDELVGKDWQSPHVDTSMEHRATPMGVVGLLQEMISLLDKNHKSWPVLQCCDPTHSTKGNCMQLPSLGDSWVTTV